MTGLIHDIIKEDGRTTLIVKVGESFKEYVYLGDIKREANETITMDCKESRIIRILE